MRVLIVGSNMRIMMQDVQAGLMPSSVESVSLRSGEFRLKDGSEIRVANIENMDDVDRLSGLRFDLVVEHETFSRNYELYIAVRNRVQR